MRGLIHSPDSENVPTDKEIADALKEAIEEQGKKSFTPFKPFASTDSGSGGGGWGGWSSWGGGGGWGWGGSGGGGYYGPNVYFSEMRDFADIRTPYGNNIPFINTSNPIIRRGDVRRERVWSERGRLLQWQ
jgi:hypothetical protein